MKKGILLLLLALILISTPVEGAETSDSSLPKVYVLENYQSPGATEGGLLFLFSQAVVDEPHDGNIYVVGGNIELQADVSGTVFLIGATCTMKSGKPSGGIITLSSTVEKNTDLGDINIHDYGLGFFQQEQIGDYNVYDYTIPWYFIYAALSFFEISVFYIFYALKRGFIEQGAILPLKSPLTVISGGVIIYFLIFILLLLFVMSIYMIPVALLAALAAYCLILIGQASLSISIGYALLHRFIKQYSSSYLILGALIIELLKLVPFVGAVLVILVLPALSFGTAALAIYNGFVRKRFYAVPFQSEPEQKRLDNSAARGIILGKTNNSGEQ